MLKPLIALALSFSVLLPVPQAGAQPARKTSQFQWAQDLDELVAKVEQTHPDPWAVTPREDFLADAQALRARLPTMSRGRTLIAISELLASLGDSRLVADLEPQMVGAPVLPVQLIRLDDGVFVHAAELQHGGLVGGRVIELEGRPIEEVLDRVDDLFAWETVGRRDAQAPRLAQFVGALAYVGVVTRSNVPIRIEVERANGERVMKSIEAIPYRVHGAAKWRSWLDRLEGTVPVATKYAGALMAAEYLPESKAMYIVYSRCMEDPAEPLAGVTGRILDDAHHQGATRLVLDLRFNSGGEAAAAMSLVEAIAADERFSAPGSVCVLVGRATIGAGVSTALALKERGAVLFGEPTGSGPDEPFPAARLTLTNSGLVVVCPTAPRPEMPSAVVEPDVRVSFLGADLFAGHDAALAAALAYDAAGEPEEITSGG